MKRIKPLETEAMIQRRICDYLEAHGWLVFSNRSGKMNALAGRMAGGSAKDNGSPDLMVWGCKIVRPVGGIAQRLPRHFVVEVKRPGGKQSDAQLVWAGEFCKTGHSYVLAYSHEDIERFLQSKGWL